MWEAGVLCKTGHADVGVLDENGYIGLDCWSVMFYFTAITIFGIRGLMMRIGTVFLKTGSQRF